MNFNYTVTSIRIPSRWFDVPERKKNTFQKMGGSKGFNLYLQLYKFRLHNQENEHTFITSISLLRKETGYTSRAIFELLKSLKSAKIINISGASRWEYLLDENKNPLEDKLLHITVREEESNPIYSGFDKELDDYYIYVSFDLLQKYKKTGLDEKHFALHCLIQRLQKGKNKVCFMAIETMAEVLDIDKDTVNRMIFNMNRHYLLVSWRKSNEKKRGTGSYRYEHITYEESKRWESEDKSNWEGWLFHYKTNMDKMSERADKRAERKRKQRSKNKEDTPVKDEYEVKELFNLKKPRTMGEPDPFENVDNENIVKINDDEELLGLFG